MNVNDHRADLARIARDAGATAWVHAVRLSGPSESVGLNERDLVPIASLYKLPLALVWADMSERRQLNPKSVITLSASDRIPGPTGVAMLLDDVTMSQRDIVRLMLAVSDNGAGDAILSLVGLDHVTAQLEKLGLPASLVRQGSAEETLATMRDTGADSWITAQRALADPDSAAETSQYDPAFASSGTASDVTTVLRMLWSGSGESRGLIRDAMSHQVWRHRIGSGFPHDDVAIYGKTASLGSLRHETAIVHFPHEHPVAVTVLTRAVRPERYQPRLDAAIGELARRAVTPLRMPDS